MNRAVLGKTQYPKAEAKIKNKLILSKISRTLDNPLDALPKNRARNRDTPKTPKVSSMAAAPYKVVPTLLRKTFNSIKVWAEIPILVDARIKPMNSACLVSNEKTVAKK